MVGLHLHLIDGDDAVGTHDAAARAADTLVRFRHVGVVVTFSVDFFSQADDTLRAVDDAYTASLATLSVNNDGSFNTCHIFLF